MNIIQDFKERFLNFKTFRGAYALPLYSVALYVVIFHLQYAIQAYFGAVLIDKIVSSIRDIAVNPIKQAIAVDTLKEARTGEKEAAIQDTAAAVKEAVVPETAAAVKKAIVPATAEIVKSVVAQETAAAVEKAIEGGSGAGGVTT